MKRLPILLLCSLLVCWLTVALAWVVGLLISCAFIDGCYERFGALGLMRLIDLKSVFTRGTLLSLVFIFFAWMRIRRNR